MSRMQSSDNHEAFIQNNRLEPIYKLGQIRSRKYQISNQMKDQADYQTCTKYEACLKNNFVNLSQSNQNIDRSFQIPQIFLKDEQPLLIQLSPVLQATLSSHEVDLLIQKNIQKHAAQQSEIKKQEIQLDKCARLKLKQINEKAQYIRQQCKKQQLEKNKRPQWNHSLFSVNKSEVSPYKEKQPQKSHQKRAKIDLKPISQRIIEYKHKQNTLLKQKLAKQACQHNHNGHSHNTQAINEKIQLRAKQILSAKKKQKQVQLDNRKALQSKIKAIELQSKANVNKCKKKPLDSNIEFIVQIPEQENKNKKGKVSHYKQKNSIPEAVQENIQKPSRKPQKKQIKNHKRIYSQSSNPNNTKKLQNNSESGNMLQIDNFVQSGNKFYLWNIPIYKNDCQTFGLQEIKGQQNFKKQKPSFRDEVSQYLQEQNHAKMRSENQKDRISKFNQLVEAKKQQFIKQYSESSKLHLSDEIFWNEDELHKFTSIPNFTLA